ncbi:uncharacterized protein LOC119729126 isoform X2 [Patiria miniata]|uniref:Uncharacterized protein n=1 Tax=Patiria miniata TaxID=46514 RepID=A0A914A118_PATMI|nr:uncharacterized protein LOC119729126 isoform X2 [Patiria miniata]
MVKDPSSTAAAPHVHTVPGRKSRYGSWGFTPSARSTLVALPKTYPDPAVAAAAAGRKMRLGGRGAMGRYCRLLVALIVCSTVVSMILLSRLWGLGSGVSGGYTGSMFGGKSGLVNGLFASVTRKVVDPFEEEFKGKDRMPPSVESMEEKKKSHTGDALLDYYLTMYIDGKEITWYSEVNNRGILMEAMKDYLAMMVESDVQVRWDDVTKKKNGTAVISSKPDTPADITLSDWLTIVARYSNKGVKLNYASTHALMYGMPVLSNLKSILHAPVWVHADILPGPNGNTAVSVNPEDFIKMTTSSLLPKLSLSVGWTTAWNPDPVQQRYTWHNVIAMARACALIKAPVSFSVRAVFASKSTRQLKWLLSLAKRFTVTVWADKYDIMPVAELVYFRQIMDRKKVFYNLPYAFMENLKDVSPNTKSVGTEGGDKGPTWNRNLWDPVLIHDNSLAFLGKEQAVLDGPGCWLVSKVPYKPEIKKSKTAVVSGKVHFVDTDLASPSENSVLDVYIRNSGVNQPPPDQVQGVRLRIHQDGSLQLAPVNLNQAGAFKLQSTAKLPASDCYEFQLVDKGDGYPLYCTVKLWQCTPGEETEADPLATSVALHLNVAYEMEKQLFYVAINGGSDKNAVVLEQLSVDDKAWT